SWSGRNISTLEMIDLGAEVCPHDRVARAVRLGQVRSRELTGARGRPGCGRSGRCRRRSGSGRAAGPAFGDELLLGLAAGLDGGPLGVAFLDGFLLRES